MDPTPTGALLDVLAAEYWDAYLEAHPLFATAIGHGHGQLDTVLPDPTPEGAAGTRAVFERLAERAAAIATADLDADGRITHDALREALGSDIAELETGLPDWNVDPLEGIPAALLLLPDYQALATPEDGRHMVDRWRAMAAYVDAHIATLRRSMRDGRVACRAPVHRNIDILDALLERPDPDWPLLAPLRRGSGPGASWSPADWDRFAADLGDAVAGGIRPAFERLRAALVDEVLPAARTDERPGMCHVPSGEGGYRHLIRVHTSLDLTPEELHATGLAEIERIDREMAELAARTLGTRSLPEALAALRGDPALHFSTRDEVFDTAVTCLRRANEAMPDWFGRLPAAPCDVVRMGAHEEEHSTIAYYRQPAPDGSRPGQFFLNTSHPETRPRYELEALTYHESVPGHHLQIAIGQELPLTAEFRHHLGPTAFFEGWGLYTERLSDEMGLYTGDLDRIGVLSYDAWRASRLVVDTGMHAFGWSRQRAIDFMLEHTALASNNIVNEVDRYIVLPGQALAYKTGQLELLRLRAEARERMGAAFDIRGFHDTVLGQGAIALPTLRMIVEAWSGGAPTAA